MTAGEVRKRLALYYHGAEKDSEVRMELPVGSYVPRFHSLPVSHLEPGLADDLAPNAVSEVSDLSSDRPIEPSH